MAARIQIRRDFSSNWTLNNPILTEGELGYELDSGKLKVGDGIRSWNNLSYFQETVNYSDVIDPPRNLSYFNNDAGYLRSTDPAGLVTQSSINNWNTAYSWGNHASAGYLLSSTASSTYLTIANAAISYQPVDGDLTAIAGLTGATGLLRKTAANTWTLDNTSYLTTASVAAGVDSQDINNWNSAFSWGDHADAGYLTIADAQTQYQPFDADLSNISSLTGNGFLKRTGANAWELDTNTYLTVESDPVFSASAASNVTSTLINNWNTAYSWGNHASAGYLTSIDADLTAIAALTGTTGLLRKTAANTWQLDTNEYLTSADAAGGISGNLINNWNTAYSWGDHALEGYLLASTAASSYQPLDSDLTAISGISTNGLLRRAGPGSWTVDTNTYLTTSDASSNYQPLDSDLTTIAGLTTNGLLRRTAGTWGVDTNTYLTTSTAASTYQPILATSVPATTNSAGTAGTLAYDATHLYICIATNTWRRIELTTWP